jgi:hypothetical protein
MKKYMELEVYIHFFLTSLVDVGEWLASRWATLQEQNISYLCWELNPGNPAVQLVPSAIPTELILNLDSEGERSSYATLGI